MKEKIVIVGTGNIASHSVISSLEQHGIEVVMMDDVAELKEIEDAHQLPTTPTTPYPIDRLQEVETYSKYPNNRKGRRQQARDLKRKSKTTPRR